MTNVFAIDLTKVKDWEELQGFMDYYHDGLNDYLNSLASELGVTFECASDVWYLRSRSRHTPALELELIRLHREGTPPNICEFPL